ncbi:MAG: hypothetical protein HXY50_06490 [Ignavibacteriaceae bacterium]|nr:hypothetical protein [Ignavibacteriaceae bacterium]
MSIINLQSKTPEHVFDIVLTIDDSDSNEYTYKMRKLGEFQYGNDEDVDTILYPSNVKIEFTFTASDVPLHFGGGTYGSYKNFDKEYYNLINKFSFYDTAVVIDKDGVEYFRGFVDQKNKGGSFEERTIEITALSDFSKLKDIDPRTLDAEDLVTLPEHESGPVVLLLDAIRETIKLAIPTFNDIVLITDIKSQTDYNPLDPWIADAQYFGQNSDRFWGAVTPYTTGIELIKAILSSLGCLAIMKGSTFYIISRWYVSDETPITLLVKDFVKDEGPIPYYSKKLDGLRVSMYSNPTASWYHQNYGTVEMVGDEVINEDNVEMLTTSLIGGTTPGAPPDVETFFIRVPDGLFGDAVWISELADSCYGGIVAYADRTALWDVVGQNVWNQIQYDRLVYQLTCRGTDWEYDKYYQFENGLTETFRPRKLRFDYPAKSTILDLIKC